MVSGLCKGEPHTRLHFGLAPRFGFTIHEPESPIHVCVCVCGKRAA